MRVKIEPIRKNTTRIPQCKNCQGFNHTQKYCGRDSWCVKCAGKHSTQTCEMQRNTQAKCINCKGQHPASYRGCSVAKQLQKLRDQKRKNSQNRGNRPVNTHTSKLEEKSSRQNIHGERKTYAQIVKNSNSVKLLETSDNQIIQNLMASINAITKQLDEQNNLNKLMLEQIKKLEPPERKANNKQK